MLGCRDSGFCYCSSMSVFHMLTGEFYGKIQFFDVNASLSLDRISLAELLKPISHTHGSGSVRDHWRIPWTFQPKPCRHFITQGHLCFPASWESECLLASPMGLQHARHSEGLEGALGAVFLTPPSWSLNQFTCNIASITRPTPVMISGAALDVCKPEAHSTPPSQWPVLPPSSPNMQERRSSSYCW